MQRMKSLGDSLRLGVYGAVVCALVAMSGCGGFGSYSPSEGYRGVSWANDPQISSATRQAVVAAVDRAGIDGPYAVRLPAGMDSTRTDRVRDALNDADARLLVGDEATDLPELIVERVVIRVNIAEVDVSIPAAGMIEPDGSVARQLTTYYLKSEFGRWRIARLRTWSVGVNERAIADVERAADELEAGAVVVEEAESAGSDEPPF